MPDSNASIIGYNKDKAARKNGFWFSALGAGQCGFDSNHPLQSPPTLANDSQDYPQRRGIDVLSRDGLRWSAVHTQSPRRYVLARAPWVAQPLPMNSNAQQETPTSCLAWPEVGYVLQIEIRL